MRNANKCAFSSTENTSLTTEDKIDFTSSSDVTERNNLCDWNNERELAYNLDVSLNEIRARVLYQGPLKYRSRLLIKYNSVTAIFTDEPCLYLYSLNKGILKAKYNIANYHYLKKNKNKFALR